MDEMTELPLAEQKRLWEGLRLQPAWNWLMVMAQSQVVNRRDMICEPMQPGQEYAREFLKGEVSGINTFMVLVDTTISVIDFEIAKLNQEPNDVNK